MMTKILLIYLGLFAYPEDKVTITDVRWIYVGAEGFSFDNDTLKFTSERAYIPQEFDRSGKSNFICIEFQASNLVQYYSHSYDKEPPVAKFLDDGDKSFRITKDIGGKRVLEMAGPKFYRKYQVVVQKREGHWELLLVKIPRCGKYQ